MAEHFMHIPMPGDHYSPVTGSSVITVIHKLTRQHLAAGGWRSSGETRRCGRDTAEGLGQSGAVDLGAQLSEASGGGGG